MVNPIVHAHKFRPDLRPFKRYRRKKKQVPAKLKPIAGAFHDRSTNALHPATSDSSEYFSKGFSWDLKSILTVARP